MSGEDDELQRIYDWYQRVQSRKLAPAVERDIWIMAGRHLFVPGERDVCEVCGKFKSITQAHHVVPLAIQYDRGFKYPDQEYVWLCPNHHAMVHRFIQDDNRSMEPAAMRARTRRMAALHPDLSETEFEKMMELMRRACRGADDE